MRWRRRPLSLSTGWDTHSSPHTISHQTPLQYATIEWVSAVTFILCNDTAWDPPPWLPAAVHSSLSSGLHIFLFLPQPTEPQSSACKNFWRRCQGLLENTLGSLKRKRKIYRQSANEVNCAVWIGIACCVSKVSWCCMLCGVVFWGAACSTNPLLQGMCHVCKPGVKGSKSCQSAIMYALTPALWLSMWLENSQLM